MACSTRVGVERKVSIQPVSGCGTSTSRPLAQRRAAEAGAGHYPLSNGTASIPEIRMYMPTKGFANGRLFSLTSWRQTAVARRQRTFKQQWSGLYPILYHQSRTDAARRRVSG